MSRQLSDVTDASIKMFTPSAFQPRVTAGRTGSRDVAGCVTRRQRCVLFVQLLDPGLASLGGRTGGFRPSNLSGLQLGTFDSAGCLDFGGQGGGCCGAARSGHASTVVVVVVGTRLCRNSTMCRL